MALDRFFTLFRGRQGSLLQRAWVLTILWAAAAGAQTAAPRHDSFLCPRVLPASEFSFFASLAQAELPEDIVEVAALVRAPLLSLTGRMGVGGPLLLEAGISSNFATWHVVIGPKVVFERDRLRVAAGYDVAFWLGYLPVEGFDSELRGWIHYPNVAVGYLLDRFALSVEARLLLTPSLYAKIGGLRIERSNDALSGIALSFQVEQPLWKERIISIGVRAYWTKLYYPSWAAFPAYDRHFWIPELTVGLIL